MVVFRSSNKLARRLRTAMEPHGIQLVVLRYLSAHLIEVAVSAGKVHWMFKMDACAGDVTPQQIEDRLYESVLQAVTDGEHYPEDEL